jgi:hypothetical protein
MRELQRMADRVCTLILSSDLPAIDIEIEKSKVRERCLEQGVTERAEAAVALPEVAGKSLEEVTPLRENASLLGRLHEAGIMESRHGKEGWK